MEEIKTKVCIKCGIKQSISEYHKSTRNKTGTKNTCRTCCNEYAHNYQLKYSKELWRKRKVKGKNEARKKWEEEYRKNEKRRKHRREYGREYRSRPYVKKKLHEYTTTPKYREKRRIYNRNKDEEHRIRDRKQWRKQREKPHNKIINSCRARFRFFVINQDVKRYSSFGKLLGADCETIRKHLESLWQDGMSWDNYGRDGWMIDHIRPLASYNLHDPIQLSQAWHYTNLQPLWAFDNISKGAKYNGVNYRKHHQK